jgi:hypothetical protein
MNIHQGHSRRAPILHPGMLRSRLVLNMRQQLIRTGTLSNHLPLSLLLLMTFQLHKIKGGPTEAGVHRRSQICHPAPRQLLARRLQKASTLSILLHSALLPPPYRNPIIFGIPNFTIWPLALQTSNVLKASSGPASILDSKTLPVRLSSTS